MTEMRNFHKSFILVKKYFLWDCFCTEALVKSYFSWSNASSESYLWYFPSPSPFASLAGIALGAGAGAATTGQDGLSS